VLPPAFVRFYDERGVSKPYCFECVHFATESDTRRGMCRKYGAYVSLYSSCGTFERRVGSSMPIVDEDEVKASYRFGLNDPVK
jgi:hypothetical protein